MGEAILLTYPTKKEVIEDVQEVSKIEFYYLDMPRDEFIDATITTDDMITVRGFKALSFLDKIDTIKQYGEEASPQEYEALKKELYLID